MALKDIGARFVVQGEGQFVSSMGRADAAMDRVGSRAQTMGTGVRLGLTAIAAGATALAAGMAFAVTTANTFEQSFARVRKTVDGTPEELEAIKQAFIGMAQVVPVNVNELNRIGEAAGQLGIKKENIVEFTRVAAEMGVTTNLSSDQAAEGMARLANIISLPQEQFRALGSTIVDLGNNSASTESEILAMSLRLAGAGNIVGLTAGEILGMATALSSVGIEAESGGSAFSRVMIQIADNVKTGGETLELFAAVSGQTTAAFKKQFETDAAGAVVAFVKGLDKVDKAGGNVFAVLEDLELGEIRVRDALLRSAQAGDILSDAMVRGNKEMGTAAALANEANKQFATTESKLVLAANAASEASRQFGEQLQPAVEHAADAVIILINRGLIPIITSHGPGIASFLDASAIGWGIWANAITNQAVPAMDKWIGTAQGLLGVLAQLNAWTPGNILSSWVAGKLTSVFDGSMYGPPAGYVEPALIALQGMGEKAEQVDIVLGAVGERAEQVFYGMGEAAEISGEAIAGWGNNAAASTEDAGAYLDRIKALQGAMNADTDSKKGSADASRAEAEARREAAEAARAEAEALRAAKEARDAIVASITANVLGGQAAVQLGSSENPRMADFDLAVSALDKITAAGGDTSIAIALLDRTLAEFSGVLSTLVGDDLASAGAVMEGLRKLREEFDAGRIGAEEYAAGLQGLTGELGTYVTAALDAADKYAEAEKDRLADIQKAQDAYWDTISRNAESLDKQLTEAAARRQAQMEEDAKREIELARLIADQKLSFELAAADREHASKIRGYFNERLEAVLDNPGNLIAQERLADFVARHPEFKSRLSLPDPTDALSGERASIMEIIARMVRPAESVAMPVGAGAGASAGGGSSFVVHANYTNPQEPQSVRLDLEALVMAAGR